MSQATRKLSGLAMSEEPEPGDGRRKREDDQKRDFSSTIYRLPSTDENAAHQSECPAP
jgi:hypothetical protein